MASIGQLVIELAANYVRLQSDLGKAVGIVERTASKFKTAFKFAGGGLLGAAFISAGKQAIDFGDSINKASIKAGIGNRAMSELAYAAKLADVDIASLSTALKKMQVSLSEAGTGAKGPTEALAALGLTIQDVQKRKPEAQFELLADRISKLTDPADRARAAVELFGKAGADLLPLFEQGAAGIAKARAEAEKLGLSFNDEQIKKLATADDSIKRLDASWKGFATTVAAFVAGPLSAALDGLSGLDSRGVDQKIAALEKRLNTPSILSPTGSARDDLESQLRRLKGQKEFEATLAGRSTTSGEPSRGRNSEAIGFAAADAAKKAEEAAKKAGKAALKEEEKLAKEREELFAHTDEAITEHYFEELEERTDKMIENEKEMAEAAMEAQKKLDEWRAQQANKISENAQVFKDAFLNAWDDMVNTGKFSVDELFKYIIAEFARKGIAKLFDSILKPSGGGGGGLFGGIVAGDNIFKKVGAIFGFANGGRPPTGRPSIVGEEGPELFVPDSAGTVFPNGAGGGVNVTNHYDMRGASMDLMKVLPRILEQNRRATIAEVVEGFSRRKFAI